MKVITVEEMRRLEKACAQEGVSVDTLMENAGLAVARVVRELLGQVAGQPLLVLVGPGNNGGDGLVAARHLQQWRARVTAYLCAPRREPDPKREMAARSGVTLRAATDDPDLAALGKELASARLVIDAVLGTGQARPLEGTVREAMLLLQEARRQRRDLALLALDLPTGLNADTGQMDPACPAADVAVALGYPKMGHFRFPGAAQVGRLEVVDIGIPEHLAQEVPLELLTPSWVAARLPQRSPEAHKGTFGHALVVAGSRTYVGATVLASAGALRVGTGLVTLGSPQSVYPIAAAKLTEAIHLPLPEDEAGTIHPDAASLIKEHLPQYDALLLGCGLGRSEGTAELVRRLVLEEPQPGLPLVIDADGLNNLATLQEWWQGLKSPTILTPHPGEMSRLTGLPTDQVQAQRVECTREWAARWGQVVVLKGAFTVVAAPQG
ncbi:MAG: NAD(P)H-hydrate dehydratase, partial [Dehalococcoidia bacterium]